MQTDPFPEPIAFQPTAAAKRSVFLTLAGSALLGGVLGGGIVIGGEFLWSSLQGSGTKAKQVIDLWTLLCLPFSLWCCILVHEFGHLLGGWLGGMRPLILFAGPLHLEFNADRVRALLNRVSGTWGGLAVCAPGPRVGTGRLAYSLLVLGGPVSSFLLAGVAGLISVAVGGWWGGLLFVVAAISLVVGVATLIPMRSGGFVSDGGQLLGIARGDQVALQRITLGALLAQSYAGVRPRDWDAALLSGFEEGSPDPSIRICMVMLACSRFKDSGDFARADAECRRVAEILNSEQGSAIPSAVRGGFAMGIAAWVAHRRGEAVVARRWLEASAGGVSDPASRAYAEAAVALAEGDRDAARRQLEVARAALPQMSDRGGAISLSDSIDDLARELDANRPDSGTAGR